MLEDRGFQISHDTLQVLRKLRGSTVDGVTTPQATQEIASKLLTKFAKALFEAERPEKLHEKDRGTDQTHFDSLNYYIKELMENELKEARTLTSTDRYVALDSNIYEAIFNFLDIDLHRSKFNLEENPLFVSLLASGSLLFALIAYVYNLDVLVASVGGDRKTVYMDDEAEINPDDHSEVIVIDDIVGRQARAVKEHIRRVFSQNGKYDIKARVSNPLGN